MAHFVIISPKLKTNVYDGFNLTLKYYKVNDNHNIVVYVNNKKFLVSNPLRKIKISDLNLRDGDKFKLTAVLIEKHNNNLIYQVELSPLCYYLHKDYVKPVKQNSLLSSLIEFPFRQQ